MFEECLLQLKIAYFVTIHDKYAMQYCNLEIFKIIKFLWVPLTLKN